MIIRCTKCGKDSNKLPCELKRNADHFCSRKCRDDAKRTKQKIKCDNCQKDLLRTPSRIRKYANQFCDFKCKSEFLRTGYINVHGYRVFSMPKWHPLRCGKRLGRRQVQEHWLVMYDHDPSFTVWARRNQWTIHHKNGIRDDNRFENLEWKAPGTHGSGISVATVNPRELLSVWYRLLAERP